MTAKKGPAAAAPVFIRRKWLERVVERTKDADFSQEVLKREKFLFRFGGLDPAKRATAKDLAALRAFHKRNELPNRLKNARVGLLMIADTPEHEVGTALLKKAELACLAVKDETLPGGTRVRAGDSAHELLDHLIDVIRAGFRRNDVRPALSRDAQRQAATRLPRGSKMPKLDKWLDDAFKRKPGATNVELWDALPESGDPVYRDGSAVCEVNERDREHHSGRRGFDNRASKARKRRSAVSN